MRNAAGIIKPDVVLYEEGLDQKTLDSEIARISRAQVLIWAARPWWCTRRPACSGILAATESF